MMTLPPDTARTGMAWDAQCHPERFEHPSTHRGQDKPSCDDVLYAFAVEPFQGRETLERYLQDYPEYSTRLIDLSHELSRPAEENTSPLSAEEKALIDQSWNRHSSGLDFTHEP